jgi:hypothetical protein
MSEKEMKEGREESREEGRKGGEGGKESGNAPVDGIMRGRSRRQLMNIGREVGHPPPYHQERLLLGLTHVIHAPVSGTDLPPSKLLLAEFFVRRVLYQGRACYKPLTKIRLR